jgi:DNA-binding NarL/FixJ family response regulator
MRGLRGKLSQPQEISNFMNRLILADNQTIFRAGAARVLALEDDMSIVAQWDDPARITSSLSGFRSSILLVGSTLGAELPTVLAQAKALDGRVILVTENSEPVPDQLAELLDGVVCRSISGAALVDCVRRVARGQRVIQRASAATSESVDSVGKRVRDRLTPKEMQIVALIAQGLKNKAIATQLGTKEQVIKNYLRVIYDKTGVSDRLELAIFTLHHRVLAEAAAKVGSLIQTGNA